MGAWGWVSLVLLIVFCFLGLAYIRAANAEKEKERKRQLVELTREERHILRKERLRKRKNHTVSTQQSRDMSNVHVYGPLRPQIICPHCQTKGRTHAKSIKQKKGISGAKTTAALLTGGVSMLATGLSRKESNTQAHCSKCKSTWFF